MHQNEISQTISGGSDLHLRMEAVLADAAEATGFVPERLLSKSSWWGSEQIGAFHYAGTHEGRQAVLKVQGVKPVTSEIYMLVEFAKQNKSTFIRPPLVYASKLWNDTDRYEAIVMEDVQGEKLVSYPGTVTEIKKFFTVYEEYKRNCITTPWITKPDGTIRDAIPKTLGKWQQKSISIYPSHPYRKSSDTELIEQATIALKSGYETVNLEFQHGHFSVNDLYKAGEEIVLLSNLYWSWRLPFADRVFAAEWYKYNVVQNVPGLTVSEWENIRAVWLEYIDKSIIFENNENLRLLRLAQLERSTAGLVIDALTVDPKLPLAEFVVERTRQDVQKYIELVF